MTGKKRVLWSEEEISRGPTACQGNLQQKKGYYGPERESCLLAKALEDGPKTKVLKSLLSQSECPFDMNGNVVQKV